MPVALTNYCQNKPTLSDSNMTNGFSLTSLIHLLSYYTQRFFFVRIETKIKKIQTGMWALWLSVWPRICSVYQYTYIVLMQWSHLRPLVYPRHTLHLWKTASVYSGWYYTHCREEHDTENKHNLLRQISALLYSVMCFIFDFDTRIQLSEVGCETLRSKDLM